MPLARIVRTHGFPKLGVCTFKADLFSPGGQIFKGREDIYLSQKPVMTEADFLEMAWEKVTLTEPMSPHGGGFGHAKGLLIKLRRGENELRNHCVGLPRSVFPKLQKAFYVSDLLDRAVADERGQVKGVIKGFEDNGSIQVEAVNLKVLATDGREFSFPSTWVSAQAISSALKDLSLPIVVEGLDEWIIDPKIKNDEGGQD